MNAWPELDVNAEIARADAWLEANPRRRKKNYRRFIVNWLNRAQRDLLREQSKRIEAHREAMVGQAPRGTISEAALERLARREQARAR